MAVTGEKVKERRLVETRYGWTGRRVFVYEWETWEEDAPAVGSTYPGHSTLRVERREVEPLSKRAGDDGPNDDGTYIQYCRVTCQYSTETTIRTREYWDTECEALLYSEDVTWDSDGTTRRKDIPIFYTTGGYSLEVVKTWNPLHSVIRIMGKINNATFKQFSAGTLLYLGPRIREEYSPITGRQYRITHRFRWRPDGWNKIWREETRAWEEISNPPYDETGFGVLL